MTRKSKVDVFVLNLFLLYAYQLYCISSAQSTNRTCTSPCDKCNITLACNPPLSALCIKENISLGRNVNMSSVLALWISSSSVNTTYAVCLAVLEYTNTANNTKSSNCTQMNTTYAVCLAVLEYTNKTNDTKSSNCTQMNITYTACLAVLEYTNKTNDTKSSNCTRMNSTEEWLQVDLDKNCTVTNITVYISNSVKKRLSNISITVDNRSCYFPLNTSGFPDNKAVTCSPPVTGRIVRLTARYLNVCDDEIGFCRISVYGSDCNKTCGYCNNSTSCHDVNGSCPNGYEIDSEPDNTGTIIGAVVGSVVACILIILVETFAFRYLRRRKIAGKKKEDSREVNLEETAVKSQASVKPTVIKTQTRHVKDEHDVNGSVYENVVLEAIIEVDGGGHRDIGSTSYHECVLSDKEMVQEDVEKMYSNDKAIYATLKSAKQELDRVQCYLVDKLTSGTLIDEFMKLPQARKKSHDTALTSSNLQKNRFTVIVPCTEHDDNRVVLADGYTEDSANDFVNASYIKGFTSSTKYIAAQGPRDNTAIDFWRMVWQERIEDIVMLTSLHERGKSKCYEYWPARETTQVYGPVRVTTTDVQSRAYFSVRTFVLNMDIRDELKVTQYHFTAWPDHGTPTVTSLVDFWRFVKSRAKCDASCPLLVHCSAGVGRSGAYIGLDIAMDKVSQTGEINMLDTVDRMRDDRKMMVQTPEQYVFLHKALLEAYTGRDTKFSIDQFDAVIPNFVNIVAPNPRVDTEFQTVMLMRLLTVEQSYHLAFSEENVMKNRNKGILPSDDHIVYLTEYVPSRNQYINAVFMPTFTNSRGSILTQLPLSTTLVDFWRLVYGTNATTVVSLGSPLDESEVQEFCCFWNSDNETSQTGPYKVILNSTTHLGNHLFVYTVTLTKKDNLLRREIQIIRYDGWLHEVPDKSDIFRIVDMLDTTPATIGNTPLIIQCIDGGARSGLFCAILDIISRVTYDREVDVYMTVRSIQNVRPEAVTTVEQYRYCYEIAQYKVREMSVYANL